MKKIPTNAKILSVSHNDLDGAGCQILLGAIYRNIEYRNCSYNNIDKELMSIDSNDYDYIFVTDISPKVNEVLDDFDNLILIDHHQTAVNKPEQHHYVNRKYSATFLTNHSLTKMYGDEKLQKFSKLVKLINDYDLWIHKYKGSKALNNLFGLYNMKKFRERFRTGRLKLTDHEKEYLQGIQDKFDKLYDEIEIEEFPNINVCWFESDVFVNDIADKLLHEEGYDIVMFNTLKSYKVSIRSKLEDFNFGLYLQEKGIGGGHIKAAGVNASSQEEMNNVVDMLEKDLYKVLPSIRK